jgi:putative tricarboxylic transport membrane protein
MYPRWLSGFSIFIALLYIVQSCTSQVFRVGASFPGKTELMHVFSVFFACLIFVFLLDVVGFNIAGSLLLFTMFVRQYKLWHAIALSIVITYVHYFIFKVCFSVPLPEKLFNLFGLLG